MEKDGLTAGFALAPSVAKGMGTDAGAAAASFESQQPQSAGAEAGAAGSEAAANDFSSSGVGAGAKVIASEEIAAIVASVCPGWIVPPESEAVLQTYVYES